MGRSPVSGREAKKYARLAQIAGGALAVSAAVLLAVEVPMLGVRETPVEEILPPAATPTDNGQQAAAPEREFTAEDMTGIDVRLATARVAPPKKPEETAANPTDTPGTAPAEGASSQGGWRYLGSVIEPNRRIALVSIDGRQRMLAEGREVDGVRLVQVTDDRIVIEDAGVRRGIRREQRHGSPVAWVNMPEAPAGGRYDPAGMDPAAAEDMAARQAEVINRSGMSREERLKRAEEFRARAREARRARDRGMPDEMMRQRMMEAEEEMEGE